MKSNRSIAWVLHGVFRVGVCVSRVRLCSHPFLPSGLLGCCPCIHTVSAATPGVLAGRNLDGSTCTPGLPWQRLASSPPLCPAALSFCPATCSPCYFKLAILLFAPFAVDLLTAGGQMRLSGDCSSNWRCWGPDLWHLVLPSTHTNH